ncbi:hypothetical protein FKM82_026776 [Ascaphus truei]
MMGNPCLPESRPLEGLTCCTAGSMFPPVNGFHALLFSPRPPASVTERWLNQPVTHPRHSEGAPLTPRGIRAINLPAAYSVPESARRRGRDEVRAAQCVPPRGGEQVRWKT